VTTRWSIKQLPWPKIVVLLATAAVIAWSIGFLAGTLVRLWLAF
jgi:hypothetical protein